MKLYNCINCGNALYFENSTCLNCNHAIGFEAGNFTLLALKNTQNNWSPVNNQNENYRYCANAAYGTCNWLISVNQPGDFCIACSLNRVIPVLSDDKNRQKWIRIETAKHRLVYALLRLHLPVYPKINDADTNGITFDFIGDVSGTEKIMTGHDNGVIVLNIEEADEGERIKHKLDLGEKYRTLLGHFRHEIGHYYWEILIKDSQHLEKFRQLFGNEEKDYNEALEIYYNTNTPSNWNDTFISPYASSHPWEDWAETWAHYMHLMDTLETAWSFGIGIQNSGTQTVINSDPYTIADFKTIIDKWFPITFALNNLNRSMGQEDFYPFIISAPVVEKLQFIHEVCRAGKL